MGDAWKAGMAQINPRNKLERVAFGIIQCGRRIRNWKCIFHDKFNFFCYDETTRWLLLLLLVLHLLLVTTQGTRKANPRMTQIHLDFVTLFEIPPQPSHHQQTNYW